MPSGGGHLPAGDGDAGGGRAQAVGVEDQAGDSARLGRQLQAPAGGHVEIVQFDDRRRQGLAAQPLFHRPQPVGRPPRGDDDEPRRVEAEGGEAGGIEIERRLAPQHRPLGPQASGQGRAEAEGGAVIDRSRHLVQAAARQAAAHMRVERRKAEGERRHRSAGAALQRLQPRAQLLEPDGLVQMGDTPGHDDF